MVAIVGSLIPVLSLATALRVGQRHWWTRATDGLIVLATLVLSWFLIGYNFLTLSLNY